MAGPTFRLVHANQCCMPDPPITDETVMDSTVRLKRLRALFSTNQELGKK